MRCLHLTLTTDRGGRRDAILFHHGIGISPNTSLLIVMVVLALGILASVVFPEKQDTPGENANPQ